MSPEITPPAVRVAGVRVSYGDMRALDGVDLAVDPGHVHGLIGMNGSGKSSLFKALMGLVRTEAGSIEIFGQSPARARRSLLLAEAFGGFVPREALHLEGAVA